MDVLSGVCQGRKQMAMPFIEWNDQTILNGLDFTVAANFPKFATIITDSRGARCRPVIKKKYMRTKRNWTLDVDYILYSLVIVCHHSKGLKAVVRMAQTNVASKKKYQIILIYWWFRNINH